MKHIRAVLVAAAATGAVFALLSIQTISARGQEEAADRIITAIHRYEEAARHGTPAEKRIAYASLMAVLKRSEGR